MHIQDDSHDSPSMLKPPPSHHLLNIYYWTQSNNNFCSFQIYHTQRPIITMDLLMLISNKKLNNSEKLLEQISIVLSTF